MYLVDYPLVVELDAAHLAGASADRLAEPAHHGNERVVSTVLPDNQEVLARWAPRLDRDLVLEASLPPGTKGACRLIVYFNIDVGQCENRRTIRGGYICSAKACLVGM